MVSRACLDCAAVIPRGPRCPDCETKRNIARGSSTKRGYTYRHRSLSERYRRVNPLCELRFPGCQFLAVDADHKLPIRAGGLNVWSNYQAVCKPCHSRKTREDATRYPNAA